MNTNALTLLPVCVFLVASAPANAKVDYDIVALSDDPAPGTGPGVNYGAFGYVILNEAGQTAFLSFLSGNGVDFTNNTALWINGTDTGPPTLLAREGDAAPGTGNGVNYRASNSAFETPLINGAGQPTFIGKLNGTNVDPTNNLGIWSVDATTGAPVLVVRTGDTAPGTGPGINYSDFLGLVVNRAGQNAFTGILTGTGVSGFNKNDTGIWTTDANSTVPELLVRAGDAAPGTRPGVNYRHFFGGPVMNGVGQIAFRGGLTGIGVISSENGSGIWITQPTTEIPSLVVREGDAAPGTGPGVNFIALGAPAFNDAGQITFKSALTGFGVDFLTNSSGIWTTDADSGVPELVARAGAPAPGTESGVNYRGFALNPIINRAGQTSFRADLTGPGVDNSNDHGIWTTAATSGTLELVARSGDVAPGTGSEDSYSTYFEEPILNGAGQTAFKAGLSGPGIDSTNDHGIWATDEDGQLKLIIREGDLLDVDENPIAEDLRTVNSLFVYSGTSNEDGRRSAFNDRGQLAFLATFTDGTSGIFIANTKLIPEPSTVLLASVAAAGLLLRRPGHFQR